MNRRRLIRYLSSCGTPGSMDIFITEIGIWFKDVVLERAPRTKWFQLNDKPQLACTAGRTNGFLQLLSFVCAQVWRAVVRFRFAHALPIWNSSRSRIDSRAQFIIIIIVKIQQNVLSMIFSLNFISLMMILAANRSRMEIVEMDLLTADRPSHNRSLAETLKYITQIVSKQFHLVIGSGA